MVLVTILAAVVVCGAGFVAGLRVAARRLPQVMAAMTPQEMEDLAKRVDDIRSNDDS